MSKKSPKAKKSHLSAKQLAALEKLLVQDRDRALRSHQGLIDLESDDEDASVIGRDAADAGNHLASRENASILAARGVKQAREIEDVLETLRNRPERYGRCTVCEEGIAFGRLEFLPTTDRCAEHTS